MMGIYIALMINNGFDMLKTISHAIVTQDMIGSEWQSIHYQIVSY